MLRVCIGDVFKLRLLIGFVYARKQKEECVDWVVLERTCDLRKVKGESNVVEVEIPFCRFSMGGEVDGVFLELLAW